MMNFSKTTLLSILLVIFFLAAGFFIYQWWQIKGELVKQIEQNENLKNQVAELQAEIDRLQKEVEELKTSQAIEDKTIEKKKAEVTITTDKAEYRQGEIVKITIQNNSDKPILGYGPKKPIFAEWGLKKFEDNKWVDIAVLFSGSEYCYPIISPERPICCEEKVKAFSKIVEEWNQKFCPSLKYEGKSILLEKGVYRLIFTYGFETTMIKVGLEPVLKDPKTIYSNELIIK